MKTLEYIKKFLSSPYTIILCVTFFVYGSCIKYDFVHLDDAKYITNSSVINNFNLFKIHEIFIPSRENIGRNIIGYSPMTTLSLGLDSLIAGINPWWFHFTNIIYYCLSLFLVFYCLKLFLRSSISSIIGVMLFLVHPVHVEPVVWIMARGYTLGSIFFFISFILYIKNRRYAVALTSYIFSVFCHPSFIILPIVALLYDICFLSFKEIYERKRIIILLYAVVFVIFLVRFYGVAYTNYWNTYYEIALSSFYINSIIIRMSILISMLIFPYNVFSNSHFFYGLPLKELSAYSNTGIFIIILLLFLILFAWKTKRKEYVFGGLWILIWTGFFIITAEIHMRYLYMASFGYCLILAKAAGKILKSDKTFIKTLTAVIVFVIFFSFTWEVLKKKTYWQNSFILKEHISKSTFRPPDAYEK